MIESNVLKVLRLTNCSLLLIGTFLRILLENTLSFWLDFPRDVLTSLQLALCNLILRIDVFVKELDLVAYYSTFLILFFNSVSCSLDKIDVNILFAYF